MPLLLVVMPGATFVASCSVHSDALAPFVRRGVFLHLLRSPWSVAPKMDGAGGRRWSQVVAGLCSMAVGSRQRTPWLTTENAHYRSPDRVNLPGFGAPGFDPSPNEVKSGGGSMRTPPPQPTPAEEVCEGIWPGIDR